MYERITAAARDYYSRLREGSGVTFHARPGEALKHARQVAEEDAPTKALLRQIERDVAALASSGTTDLPPGHLEAAQGLLAWLKGDLASAKEALRSATDLSPGLGEASYALAMIAHEERRFEESVALWTKGIAFHPRDARLLAGRAFTQIAWGVELSESGGDPFPRWADARADCDSAIASGSCEPEAWSFRVFAEVLSGVEHSQRGEDPGPSVEEALSSLTQAEGHLSAADIAAWAGLCHAALARVQASRGADPDETYDAAEKDFGQALAADASHPAAREWLAALRVARALRRITRGQKAGVRLEEVIADLDRAVERYPLTPEVWSARGLARLIEPVLDIGSGLDPSEHWKAALDDLDVGVRLDPGGTTCLAWRAEAEFVYGALLPQERSDGGLILAHAVSDGEQATARNAARFEPWIVLSRASSLLGALHLRQGEEGEDSFRHALEAASMARQIRKEDARVLVALGEACEGLGQAHDAQGKVWKEDFRRALDFYEAAVKVTPSLETRLAPRIAACNARLR